MILQFTNSVDSPFILPKEFLPRISPYVKRSGTQLRFGKDGGKPTGDQQVNPRDIQFRFHQIGQTDTSYIALLNQIAGFFQLRKKPYFLEDTENSRRTEILLETIEDMPNRDGTDSRVGNNLLSLKMLDGHWEDLTETITSSPTGGLTNNDTLIVNNAGDIDTFPVMVLTALGSNPELKITNETTGAAFVLGSNSFVPGTDFIVDAIVGTVILDDSITKVESSIALVDGSGFITLVPGTNTLKYESIFADIDLDVKFRKRFAF